MSGTFNAFMRGWDTSQRQFDDERERALAAQDNAWLQRERQWKVEDRDWETADRRYQQDRRTTLDGRQDTLWQQGQEDRTRTQANQRFDEAAAATVGFLQDLRRLPQAQRAQAAQAWAGTWAPRLGRTPQELLAPLGTDFADGAVDAALSAWGGYGQSLDARQQYRANEVAIGARDRSNRPRPAAGRASAGGGGGTFQPPPEP